MYSELRHTVDLFIGAQCDMMCLQASPIYVRYVRNEKKHISGICSETIKELQSAVRWLESFDEEHDEEP